MNVFRFDQASEIYFKTSTSPTSVTQAAEQGVSSNQDTRKWRLQKATSTRTEKNRKIVNGILKYLGHQNNMELSLCSKGICYFQFNQFFILIEVPAESDLVFLHSMVFGLRANHNRCMILERCMQLNYMKQATRGSTLGLSGDEVNLCYSCPVSGLTRDSLVDALETFILTAVHVNQELQLVAS